MHALTEADERCTLDTWATSTDNHEIGHDFARDWTAALTDEPSEYGPTVALTSIGWARHGSFTTYHYPHETFDDATSTHLGALLAHNVAEYDDANR